MTEREQVDWDAFYQKEPDITETDPAKDLFRLDRCKAALRVLPRGHIASLLDVGCGDGVFCQWIGSQVAVNRLAGVDVSTVLLERAKRRCPGVELHLGKLPNLPFADNEFQVVTLIEVLEHLPDPVSALREIFRVSSSHAVVTVPDRREPSVVMCPHCLKTFPISGHLHYFDPAKLRTVVEQAGFVVEEIRVYRRSPYGSIPAAMRWAARLRDTIRFALDPMARGKYLVCRARKG